MHAKRVKFLRLQEGRHTVDIRKNKVQSALGVVNMMDRTINPKEFQLEVRQTNTQRHAEMTIAESNLTQSCVNTGMVHQYMQSPSIRL